MSHTATLSHKQESTNQREQHSSDKVAQIKVLFGRPTTRPAAGSVTDDDRRRRQTTDASEQNNTGPLGGPVMKLVFMFTFYVTYF